MNVAGWLDGDLSGGVGCARAVPGLLNRELARLHDHDRGAGMRVPAAVAADTLGYLNDGGIAGTRAVPQLDLEVTWGRSASVLRRGEKERRRREGCPRSDRGDHTEDRERERLAGRYCFRRHCRPEVIGAPRQLAGCAAGRGRSLAPALLLCQERLVLEGGVDGAGELSFEAAEGFASALAVGLFAFEVRTGGRVDARLGDRDPV